MTISLHNRFEAYPCRLLFVALICLGCAQLETGAATKPIIPATPAAVYGELTALDKYVATPDTNYSFHLVTNIQGSAHTTFILEMTSQAWLTTNEVDRPLWKHWMTIVKPDDVATAKSLLFIGGGANGGSPPKSADGNLVQIAVATKSVIPELRMT